METAKKSDHQRYTMLWRSCIYASTPRVIFVARLLIDDTDLAQPNWRICDMATMLVQSESGVDFGLKYKQTADERDVAIKKAKVWLAKNPQPAMYEMSWMKNLLCLIKPRAYRFRSTYETWK